MRLKLEMKKKNKKNKTKKKKEKKLSWLSLNNLSLLLKDREAKLCLISVRKW